MQQVGDSRTPPGAKDPVAEAEFALLDRPSFSIRKKVALCFLICFVVTGGVTVASWIILDRIEVRLHFLALADAYTGHIQQARRYEKNFLLYGTDLPSVLENVREARSTLSGAQPDVDRVVGVATRREMAAHLDRYEALLGRLDIASDREAVVAELREHGGEMVDLSLRVVEAERRTVQGLLRVSRLMPLAATVILLGLILYVVRFLTRQILTPLGRIVGYAHRISGGDFSPIFPARKYRDEFTSLVVAMNRMTRELDRRQEMLAEGQKLRAIGTLTAGVAHELNNPINNISLTAEALLEDYAVLSEEERLDMARDVLAQAERAQGVVRNLLDFSRQREVRMDTLDVADLLARTGRLLANQVRLAGAALTLDVPGTLPPIRGDGQQLAQVLVNLYLNALEAMGPGGRITVAAGPAPDRPGFLRITVGDTGRGIAPEDLPCVFDPFFTTKGAKGIGLGLSVSYGIVAEHGGTIEVESRPGHGTTFTIHLPVEGRSARPDAEGPAEGDLPERPPRPDRERPHGP